MTVFKGARGVAAALGFMLALCSPVVAQGASPAPAAVPSAQVDPGQLAAARDFLRASNTETTLGESLPVMFDLMSMAMLPTFAEMVPEEQREAFNKSSGAILADAKRKAVEAQPKLVERVAALYAGNLSAAELKAATQFYRSAVGKKFHNATPELQAQITDISMSIAYGKPVDIVKQVDAKRLQLAKAMLASSRLERTLNTVAMSMTERGGDEVVRAIFNRRGEMKDAFAALYAKAFSEAEITEIHGFYTSPEGARLTETIPTLVKETHAAMMAHVQEFGSDAAARLAEGQQQRQGRIQN
jgi:hypothetical protein